jgi:hypothetical protein
MQSSIFRHLVTSLLFAFSSVHAVAQDTVNSTSTAASEKGLSLQLDLPGFTTAQYGDYHWIFAPGPMMKVGSELQYRGKRKFHFGAGYALLASKHFDLRYHHLFYGSVGYNIETDYSQHTFQLNSGLTRGLLDEQLKNYFALSYTLKLAIQSSRLSIFLRGEYQFNVLPDEIISYRTENYGTYGSDKVYVPYTEQYFGKMASLSVGVFINLSSHKKTP